MKRSLSSTLYRFLFGWQALAALILLVNIGMGLILPETGAAVDFGRTWKDVAAPGFELTAKGDYSPLPTIAAMGWQSLFGARRFSGFLYKTLLFSGAMVFIWWTARTLFDDRLVRVVTLYLTVLSPYLVWSFYIGRDVDLDILAVSVLMFFAARVVRNGRRADLLVMAFAGAGATMVREPQVVVLPVLLVFFALTDTITVRWAAVGAVVFVAGLTPLLAANYAATDTLTLSIRSGRNLYYGNHPNYLAGHPVYDIDAFLRGRAFAELADRYGPLSTPAEIDAGFREMAIDELTAHPLQAVYRSLMKAVWWIGPVRIPHSDASAYLDARHNIVVLESGQSAAKEIAYLLHRLTVLVLMLFYWKHPAFAWKKAALLVLPVIALLPVVMITFPDTRFRLALDPYWHLLAAAGLVAWGRTWSAGRGAHQLDSPAVT